MHDLESHKNAQVDDFNQKLWRYWKSQADTTHSYAWRHVVPAAYSWSVRNEDTVCPGAWIRTDLLL